jgi:hypothetical protein
MQNNYPKAKSINRTDMIPECIIDIAAADEQLSSCDVLGFGTFNRIKLENAAGEIIIIDGPLDVMMIQGRIKREKNAITVKLRCLAAKPTFNGITVIGGKLLSGESSQLELTFTPVHSINSDEIKSDSQGSIKSAGKWAQAVAASEQMQHKNSTDRQETALPAQGDIILHRQFGKCKVIKISDDHISIQKPNGRIIQLGLQILKFYKEGTQNSKTIWKLSVSR